MDDEKYVFLQDLREKKITGYSARKQRSHCGKGGRVKLPSDYLTKKELMKMSGECKSYRLNEPMKWAEFKKMPDDIKKTYIQLLRQKYAVPNAYLAEMFGVSDWTVSQELKRLGLARGKGIYDRSRTFDKDGFYAWRGGIPTAKTEEEVKDDIPAELEDPAEEVEQEVVEEESAAVTVAEEDLPWNNPEEEEPIHHTYVTLDSLRAIPETGSMTFTGNATQIMNTLVNLLGGAKVLLSVKWDVVED